MHYKNGREAKNGDKVVLLPAWGSPVIGILYDAQAGNDHCNGKIAPIAPNDPCPNLKEVLHFDDVKAAIQASEITNRCPSCYGVEPNPPTCKDQWHVARNQPAN